nr:MAG TPA: hypothetical protein [Caudoviricetes sp.]
MLSTTLILTCFSIFLPLYFFFLTHYLYGLVTVYLFWCDVELL